MSLTSYRAAPPRGEEFWTSGWASGPDGSAPVASSRSRRLGGWIAGCGACEAFRGSFDPVPIEDIRGARGDLEVKLEGPERGSVRGCRLDDDVVMVGRR